MTQFNNALLDSRYGQPVVPFNSNLLKNHRLQAIIGGDQGVKGAAATTVESPCGGASTAPSRTTLSARITDPLWTARIT